jgi:hypothetical protein
MSTAPQAAPERRETEAPVGTVHVFDPHPLESVESDLRSVHVKPGYDRHRGLL